MDYQICHEVSLAKSDKGITVKTTINNNAKDHRLILRLPSTVEGDTYEAAQAFGYVTRPCGDDKSTAEWKEYGFAQRNMANICAKRNKNRGLAFVSAYGLHECGVWPNGDMDVTLMRCFSKTVGTSGEPDGQLQEKLEYLYRIIPYTEKDSFSELQREQDFLAAGIYSTAVKENKIRKYRPIAEVVGEDIIYSAADKVGEQSELRVFNDGDKSRHTKILLPSFAKMAYLSEIDGRPIAPLTIKDGWVSFDLAPFKIATVRFQ